MYSTSHSTILLNTLLQILKNSVINIKMYTVGGLFSGIGGIELGFEKAGFKILWSNENDENCKMFH